MQKRLVMVTAENNNKFYNMTVENNSLILEWGRIGDKTSTMTKPSSEFDKIFKEKIKKGYIDVTQLKELKTTGFDFSSFCKKSKDFYNKLLEKSKHFISEKFVSSSFTDAQVKEIEIVLSKINAEKDLDANKLNLLHLLAISPRKIKSVPIFINEILNQKDGLSNFIKSETDTLANIKIGISSAAAQTAGDKAENFLNADVSLVTDSKELAEIYALVDKYENYSNKITQVFAIKSKDFSEFDNHVKKHGDKTKLLFHGSRTENWFSIIKTKLTVTPSNVKLSGNMFGYGVYFADKFRKSVGYTSIASSYWAKGSDSTAYIGIYSVNMIKPLVCKKQENFMCKLTLSTILEKGFRTLHAKGGVGCDIKNDEFIVYENDASTIKYIIEFQN